MNKNCVLLEGKRINLEWKEGDKLEVNAYPISNKIVITKIANKILNKDELNSVFLHERAHFNIFSNFLLPFYPWIAFCIVLACILFNNQIRYLNIIRENLLLFFLLIFISFGICMWLKEILADRYAVIKTKTDILKNVLKKTYGYNKGYMSKIEYVLRLYIFYPFPCLRFYLIDKFNKKKSNRISSKYFKIYFKCLPYVLSLLAAILLGPILFCLSFYLHESGHILYGFFDNLLTKGIIAKFEISNWVEFPLLSFIKLPQQTRIIEGHTSLNYAFGGIMIIVVSFSVFSWYYYKNSKNRYKKAVFLFPVIFLLNEVFSNFLCGTDNFIGKPSPICGTSSIVNFIIISIPYLLMIPFFLLFIPIMERVANRLKKRGNRKPQFATK